MNPYLPEKTVRDAQCAEAGRAALLARWKKLGAVTFSKEVLDDAVVSDRFVVHDTPATLPDTWKRELAALGFDYEVFPTMLYIYVPHEYYLRDRRCCLAVTTACVSNVVVSVAGIVALVAAATAIAP